MLSTKQKTDYEEAFRKYIRESGLKYTPERQAIMDIIFSTDKHLEADEILMIARSQGKRVSKATIYRTLHLLQDAGLLSEINFGERFSQFERSIAGEHHDHLMCRKCGKLIEFQDERIDAMMQDICQNHGFTDCQYEFTILGICEKCGSDGE